MATEGESPIGGVLLIGAAGFVACVALVVGMLAVAEGSGLLWLGALGLVLLAIAGGWFGWSEVVEATRFRRGMEAHRYTMLRAGLRP